MKNTTGIELNLCTTQKDSHHRIVASASYSDEAEATTLSFPERFQHECIEGSAIAPTLFNACVEFIEDTGFWEPQQAIGWEVKTQWQTRKPHSFGTIAMLVQEDGSYWQGKPQHRRTDKDGKQPKYEAVKGLGNRPYLPPVPRAQRRAIAKRYGCEVPPPGASFWAWLAEHPEIPVIITEGAKKALSLLSLGYVAIALFGVNSGYQKLAPGLYRLLPELSPYLVNQRCITLAFDQDTTETARRRVAIALNRFSCLLERNGNSVKVATWERSEATKGADDLIASRGPDAMHQAIASATSWTDQRLLLQLQRQLTKPATLRVNVHLSAIDVESIPTSGVVAIASAKATGKTGLIERTIAGDTPALLAGHRIALMRNLCERLKIDYRGDLDRHQGKFINGSGYTLRVGSCVDSLLAINPNDFTGCDLVIDEVVQVMRHLLTSSTCNKDGKRPALLTRLHQLVQVARRVILADADLNNAVLDYFTELRGGESAFLLRNDHQGHAYPCEFIESPDASPAIDRLLNAVRAGQRIFIATDSKAGSKKLSQLIKQLKGEGLRVLLLNSETSGGNFERAFIQRPGSNLKGIDVVIATPSMATGVSIEGQHFDAVYGLFWGHSSTDADMAQALIRVRQPIPRVVWCAQRGGNFSPISRDTNHIAIKAALKDRTDATAMLVRSQLRAESAQAIARYDWQSDPHLNLWARVEAERNRSMWNLRDCLRVRLQHEGNTVKRVRVASCIASVQEAMKAARDAVKQQEAQAIAQARNLDPIEAEALEAKALETQATVSHDDQLALSKFAIANFYCVAPAAVDKTLVERDNGGRLRGQLRSLEEFITAQNAIARDISSIDRQDKWKGLTPWDVCNAAARQKVRAEVLGLAEFLEPGREWTAQDLAPHAQKARDYAPAVQAALNFSISDRVSDVQIIHQQLEALGLKIEFRWSREVEGKEGQKVRVYRLSEDYWQFAQNVLQRRSVGSPPQFNDLQQGGDPIAEAAKSPVVGEVVGWRGRRWEVHSHANGVAQLMDPEDWVRIPVTVSVHELELREIAS